MNWITLNAPKPPNVRIGLSFMILRITFALFMIVGHGWGKFEKILYGDFGFADPLGLGAKTTLFLAVFAELLCAVLVIIGLATRWALIPLMFTMFVAGFVVNAGEPFTAMEKAIMFLVVFAVVWYEGPGSFALDNIVGKKTTA